MLGSVKSRGGFKFELVDGSGVSCFEPDVTGCGFVFLRLEFLDGGLVVVVDIKDCRQGRRSEVSGRKRN